MEEDNSLGNDLTTIRWSRRRNVGNEVQDRSLVEIVVLAMDVEAVTELLQKMAELISTPSMKL
jgi:hypothetical protein